MLFVMLQNKTIKGLKETTHGYKKERNKANDFTCKLQYDVSIFSNRRQSDFTKCSLMISQREIMISQREIMISQREIMISRLV